MALKAANFFDCSTLLAMALELVRLTVLIVVESELNCEMVRRDLLRRRSQQLSLCALPAKPDLAMTPINDNAVDILNWI